MSREVKIPSDRDPFVAEINGVKYEYKAGSTATVPDEVAALIENNAVQEPRKRNGYFYVYHSGMRGGGINEEPEPVPYEDGMVYDLTQHITYGRLYGGYSLPEEVVTNFEADDGTNWNWKSTQTADGRYLKPVEGQTYVLKEIPWGYLKLYGRVGTTGGVIVSLWYYTAIPDLKIDDIGFYISKNWEAPEKKSLPMVYKYYTISGVKYYPADMFGEYGVRSGWLGAFFIQSSNGYDIEANDCYIVQPWYTTNDGVEVKCPQIYVSCVRDKSLNADTGLTSAKSDIAAPYDPDAPEEDEAI